MAPSVLHLPNGQNLTVTPVFGGLFFKSNELSSHHAPFPPGWTVVINTEDEEADDPKDKLRSLQQQTRPASAPTSRPTTPVSKAVGDTRHRMVHRFTKPTLNRDHLFISSISQPSSADFRPNPSPTRQIAMMLWATLWWYFHQPEPDLHLKTKASLNTPEAGKPKGQWRININREGVFKSKLVLPKLERMGLIASDDSAVGCEEDERNGDGWLDMFVSRRVFWQLDARIYLFTLVPVAGSPFPGGTPVHSRPGSPSRQGDEEKNSAVNTGTSFSTSHSPGPFHSSSHLPTFYPPPPTQLTITNGVIHPVRPKPPGQGETFYTRYIPSVGQYLSFRVASTSLKPHVHRGPVSSAPIVGNVKQSISDTVLPTISSLALESCDPELLHKWMNDPRVSRFWGEQGPQSHQDEFLRTALRNKHSFPAIGCWDGKPFGYFEIYWVKEDNVGRYLPRDAGNYDRGIHCLVGEQEFRGPQRVKIWLSALVHFCWLSDLRTETVIMEPRVDNEK